MAQVPGRTTYADPQAPSSQASHSHPHQIPPQSQAAAEPGSGPPKPKPIRKRTPHRRSPQACDECRLRKRACDAVEPCGPCRASRLVCTYSFRRPIPPPTSRIRDLQAHLQLARSWLQDIQKKVPAIPGLDIDECLRTLDYTQPEAESPPASSHQSTDAASSGTIDQDGQEGEFFLPGRYGAGQTGLEGHVYHGVFSEVTFVIRMLHLFAPCAPGSEVERARLQVVSSLFARPLPEAKISEQERGKWPGREALALMDVAFSRRHPLLAFLPEHDLARLAQEPVPQDGQMRPLVHFTIALGHLFNSEGHRNGTCESCRGKGTRQFQIGMAAVNVLNVNNLVSLQALVSAVVFLVLTSRLASAHPLIGVACSAAHRLGLHDLDIREDLFENVASIRLFATLVVLDLLAGLLLDVPPFIHVDHDLVSRLMDLAVRAENNSDLHTAALLRQACLLAIPTPTHTYHGTTPLDNPDPYLYSASLRNLESVKNRLRTWKQGAAPLMARLNDTKELIPIKRDLEITYDFCQIILFRPHLHHLQLMADGGAISTIKSHHALACLRISSSHIMRYYKMPDRASVLLGTWLPTYTIFLSVMCLCFLIAAHSGTSRPSVAWQKAATGIQLIAMHQCGGNVSSSCLEVVKLVTRELSHTVFFDFDDLVSPLNIHCRTTSTPQSINLFQPRGDDEIAQTVPIDASASYQTVDGADQMLVEAQELSAELDFRHLLSLGEPGLGIEDAGPGQDA